MGGGVGISVHGKCRRIALKKAIFAKPETAVSSTGITGFCNPDKIGGVIFFEYILFTSSLGPFIGITHTAGD